MQPKPKPLTAYTCTTADCLTNGLSTLDAAMTAKLGALQSLYTAISNTTFTNETCNTAKATLLAAISSALSAGNSAVSSALSGVGSSATAIAAAHGTYDAAVAAAASSRDGTITASLGTGNSALNAYESAVSTADAAVTNYTDQWQDLSGGCT